MNFLKTNTYDISIGAAVENFWNLFVTRASWCAIKDGLQNQNQYFSGRFFQKITKTESEFGFHIGAASFVLTIKSDESSIEGSNCRVRKT